MHIPNDDTCWGACASRAILRARAPQRVDVPVHEMSHRHCVFKATEDRTKDREIVCFLEHCLCFACLS